MYSYPKGKQYIVTNVILKKYSGGRALSNERILIVEDEVDLSKMIGRYLNNEGFEILEAHDGKAALENFKSFKPQLVLLDIMLPELDGMEVCRIIRAESQVPVIILSAKNGDLDKVLSLGLGADDYITKPFSVIELIARVKAHIRRYVNYLPETKKKEINVIRIGEIEINIPAYSASVKGELLNLTSKEFEILKFLCSNPKQVFSKEQIYENIWGFNEYGEINSVVVYINKVREKLGAHGIDYIKTVWGVGYKLEGK